MEWKTMMFHGSLRRGVLVGGAALTIVAGSAASIATVSDGAAIADHEAPACSQDVQPGDAALNCTPSTVPTPTGAPGEMQVTDTN
jgi:hypothetical protein